MIITPSNFTKNEMGLVLPKNNGLIIPQETGKIIVPQTTGIIVPTVDEIKDILF